MRTTILKKEITSKIDIELKNKVSTNFLSEMIKETIQISKENNSKNIVEDTVFIIEDALRNL